MSATRIIPEPTRDTFLTAISVAEALCNAAALTQYPALTAHARQAYRTAWLALEDFDRAQKNIAEVPATR